MNKHSAVLTPSTMIEGKIYKLNIGNYYGQLQLKKEENQFFWSVEDYDKEDWVQISNELGEALLRQVQEENDD